MMAGDPNWQRRFFINATQASCLHLHVEPVTTVDGVHVGYLCPDCDAVLAADTFGGIVGHWRQEAAASLITAEHDPAHAVGRYPWTATLQMDGMALSSDYWFETQAACEEFIRDELIGTVGHYEKLEVRS